MADKTGSMGHAESERRDARLESWKEIAAYPKRDVTTLQRWEKQEGLPIYRLRHRNSAPSTPIAPSSTSGAGDGRAKQLAIARNGAGSALWRSCRSRISRAISSTSTSTTA